MANLWHTCSMFQTYSFQQLFKSKFHPLQSEANSSSTVTASCRINSLCICAGSWFRRPRKIPAGLDSWKSHSCLKTLLHCHCAQVTLKNKARGKRKEQGKKSGKQIWQRLLHGLFFFFLWPKGRFCYCLTGYARYMGWVWQLNSSDSSFMCFVTNYSAKGHGR